MVTHEDWVAEITRLAPTVHSEIDRWVTTVQCAEMWGCHRSTASHRLAKLIKNGTVETASGYRTSSTGRQIVVPVYRLKEPPNEQ